MRAHCVFEDRRLEVLWEALKEAGPELIQGRSEAGHVSLRGVLMGWSRGPYAAHTQMLATLEKALQPRTTRCRAYGALSARPSESSAVHEGYADDFGVAMLEEKKIARPETGEPVGRPTSTSSPGAGTPVARWPQHDMTALARPTYVPIHLFPGRRRQEVLQHYGELPMVKLDVQIKVVSLYAQVGARLGDRADPKMVSFWEREIRRV